MFRFSISVILGLLLVEANAASFDLSSGQERPVMVELFTSEGCSSCPPAERWLNQLRQRPDLWKKVVPMAFHVDYWNYLGWRDRFSKKLFSQRQRQYAALGHARSVYTPGFFVNGREWRDWFRGRNLPTDGGSGGNLTVKWDQKTLQADYSPLLQRQGPWRLNVAQLGFDFETKVGDGENEGRRLKHEFVVMALAVFDSDQPQWKVAYGSKGLKQNVKALVFWVSLDTDPTPHQLLAAWLE